MKECVAPELNNTLANNTLVGTVANGRIPDLKLT